MCGGLWGPMGSYGDLWVPMGTSADFSAQWQPMGIFRDLWGPTGFYGYLWQICGGRRGPVVAFGVPWGPYRCNRLARHPTLRTECGTLHRAIAKESQPLAGIGTAIARWTVQWTSPPYRRLCSTLVLHTSTYLSFSTSAIITVVLQSLLWMRLFMTGLPVLPLQPPMSATCPLHVMVIVAFCRSASQQLATLNTDNNPGIYIMDPSSNLEVMFAQHGPLRIAWGRRDRKVLGTHGVPWDRNALHPSE